MSLKDGYTSHSAYSAPSRPTTASVTSRPARSFTDRSGRFTSSSFDGWSMNICVPAGKCPTEAARLASE
nr:MAG TPA: hypothetical protein [Caudoviricetes sp.]